MNKARIIRYKNATQVRFHNRRVEVIRSNEGDNRVGIVNVSPQVTDEAPVIYMRYRQRGALYIRLSNEAAEALMYALADYLRRDCTSFTYPDTAPEQSET